MSQMTPKTFLMSPFLCVIHVHGVFAKWFDAGSDPLGRYGTYQNHCPEPGLCVAGLRFRPGVTEADFCVWK